ncbi:Uncharacterized protein dnm_067680 [Desulfonema magnum]|uniref:Uncharacterized protein n=1 Tax=Desulfonema magnum TaxID=45655 RepID=A0A975BSM8_9BACT|nr:Uncharacterized protein dnm_067680 [Desulfonema magnum]
MEKSFAKFRKDDRTRVSLLPIFFVLYTNLYYNSIQFKIYKLPLSVRIIHI